MERKSLFNGRNVLHHPAQGGRSSASNGWGELKEEKRKKNSKEREREREKVNDIQWCHLSSRRKEKVSQQPQSIAT